MNLCLNTTTLSVLGLISSYQTDQLSHSAWGSSWHKLNHWVHYFTLQPIFLKRFNATRTKTKTKTKQPSASIFLFFRFKKEEGRTGTKQIFLTFSKKLLAVVFCWHQRGKSLNLKGTEVTWLEVITSEWFAQGSDGLMFFLRARLEQSLRDSPEFDSLRKYIF